MSTHKHINAICCVILVLTLLVALVFVNSEALGVVSVSKSLGYETRLFDTSRVHTLDIVMDDWDSFISTCENEEYASCTVVIDNESYKNVAIRAKGNTSLSSVANYGNDRYSFKIEFDHYESGKTYYGLDKLSLNNIIQDNTYLKDYLCYQMMGYLGVNAPLCSYIYITVNGEDFGLYLAVEGVEEGFLQRNYGSDYGDLYKPDSVSMGGGRGNGGGFDMEDFQQQQEEDTTQQQEDSSDSSSSQQDGVPVAPEEGDTVPGIPSQNGGAMPGGGGMPQGGMTPGGDTEGQTSDNSGNGFTMPSFGQGNTMTGPQGNTGGSPPSNGGAGGQMPDSGNGSDLPSFGQDGTMPDFGGEMDGSGDSSQSGDAQDQLPEENGDNFTPPSFSQGGGGFGGGPGGGMGSDDVSLIYTDDDYDSYQNIFDNAKTDITDADKDRLIDSLKQLNENSNIQEVVDVDQVIRYFVVHNFVCNFDSYTGSMIHNYYLYEEDGKLSMIPWDYNLAFGAFQSAGSATNLVNYPIDTPVSGGTVDSRPMLAWIFANEDDTQTYHQYFAQFISQYFDSGYFESAMDSVVSLISPYVQKDPTKFCTYEEFETGVSTLREFCLLRAESVSGQLDGSIPSTSDGQNQDNSSLIDASSLSIDDIDSMGMGGGMGGGRGQMGQDPGAMQEDNTQDQQSSGGSIPQIPSSGESDSNPMEVALNLDSSQSSESSGDFDPGMGGQGNTMQPPDGGFSGDVQPGQGGMGNLQEQENAQDPGGNIPFSTQQTNGVGIEGWILFGSSVVVLGAGLLIAFLFRGRRW